MITFQRGGLHVLEKDGSGLQNWQEEFFKRFASQRDREIIFTVASFLTPVFEEKGGQGPRCKKVPI